MIKSQENLQGVEKAFAAATAGQKASNCFYINRH